MRSCVFVNTYYGEFLRAFYASKPGLSAASYDTQLGELISSCFGDSDFYSKGLEAAGWAAQDIIVNAEHLQQAWATENQFDGQGLHIALEQISRIRPDVAYIQDLGLANSAFLGAIRPFVKLIAGQIACPVPGSTHLSGLDMVFTSFPHYVDRFRSQGAAAYYRPLAFEPRVLELLPESKSTHAVTFVGGISQAHGRGLDFLERLAELVPIDFWGYGADSLRPNSPIRSRHHGEAWSLQMFGLLHESRITVNRHIDVSENNANNMRLFEATGCGALLITDYKDNLNELFTIGEEVVAYRSPEECAALIKYYLSNPHEAAKIAQAGQRKTLSNYTYEASMKKTARVLERHLQRLDDPLTKQTPDFQRISYGHTPLAQGKIDSHLTEGWKDEDIPARQRVLVETELSAMYRGQPSQNYLVLSAALRPYVKPGSKVLEIGCASGYYYEVLEYLMNKTLDYTGVDYSEALIKMAKDYYGQERFLVADGARLPFEDRHFDIAISSGVLLHNPNYAEHIAETARVARNVVISFRTPVCRNSATQYFKKRAYDVETVELRFNEKELIEKFEKSGFRLENTVETSSNPNSDAYECTYVFKLS